MRNPYEQMARERKALAIAGFIWELAQPALWDREDFVDAVSRFPQERRDEYARMAHQRSPSTDTWEAVVGRLRALVAARTFGVPEDPFARLTEEWQ